MNETYPAEKATLDELYAAVQRDRPDDVDEQAEHWRGLSRGLKVVVAAIDLHLERTPEAFSARSSTAFGSELSRLREHFDGASRMAASNAANVDTVAQQMRSAGSHITQLYLQREASRAVTAGLSADADPDKHRELDKRFDEQAQYAMWSYASNAKLSADSVQPPTETPGEDHTVAPGGSSGPSDSGPSGPGPNGRGPDGSPSRPDNGGHFADGSPYPQLQAPPGPTAPPQPAPMLPPSGGNPLPPGGSPPPLLPPGALPPGTVPPLGKPPLPPGGGPKPTTPPPGGGRPPFGGAKPTLPPTRPGTLPGTRPPATGPRPPQSTVKPVIGSRPGSTGMAPSTPRPGTSSVNRPVIGGRAGNPSNSVGPRSGGAPAARPVTARGLIGDNGVVGNSQRSPRAVRAPRAQFGGGRVNRSVISGGGKRAAWAGTETAKTRKPPQRSQPSNPPTGGDYVWRVDQTTVPSVISGGSWKDAEHDPGFVAELEPRPTPAIGEHETVKRLSAVTPGPDDTTETGFWTPRVSTGRGIVSPNREGDSR